VVGSDGSLRCLQEPEHHRAGDRQGPQEPTWSCRHAWADAARRITG
jgi:hypothetical protein